MSARTVVTVVLAPVLLLLISGGLVGAGSPSGAATAHPIAAAPQVSPQTKSCGSGFHKVVCQGAQAACALNPACAAGSVIADPKKRHAAVKGIKEGAKAVVNPAGVLKDWVAANGPDAWAKDVAKWSAGLLSKIQTKLLDSTHPHLMTQWLSLRYGAAWLLGIILMAFAHIRAIAGMASATPEAREAVEDATQWSAGYMVGVTIAPVILMSLVDVAWSMARAMGDASAADQKSAITHYIHLLNGMQDPNTELTGGVISLFVFAGAIGFGAFIALIELTIGQYGFYLLAIMLPLVGGLAVFPKWRRPFYMVLGTLVAIILAPPALFFCYWVFWGGAAHEKDTFSLLTYLAVVGLVTASAPVVLMFVIPMLAPQMGAGAVAAGSTHVRNLGTAAARVADRQSRRFSSTGRRGSGSNRGSQNRSTQSGKKTESTESTSKANESNGQGQKQKKAPDQRGQQQSNQPPPNGGGGGARNERNEQGGRSNRDGRNGNDNGGPGDGPSDRRGGRDDEDRR